MHVDFSEPHLLFRETAGFSGAWFGEPRREAKSLEQLMQVARATAESLNVSPRPRRVRPLRRHVRDFKSFLLRTYDILADDARRGMPISSVAEWILDNFFVIEDQLREIADDLPPNYERELPKLADGTLRIHAMARELIAHTDGSLDEETLSRFVEEFQNAQPLSIGEMWAVPIMLRLTLIECLCAICSQVLRVRKCDAWAAQIHAHWQKNRELGFDAIPHEIFKTLTPELVEQFQLPGPLQAAGLTELSKAIESFGVTIPDLIHCEHQRRAGQQVTTANIITSMRLISSLDWARFFERNSLVEQTLRTDPAEVYSRLDFESRDRYRHIVEAIAKRSPSSDLHIARTAIELARTSRAVDPPNSTKSQVGYWLQMPGQLELERAVKHRLPTSKQILRFVLNHATSIYLGAIATITASLVAIFSWHSGATVSSFAIAGGMMFLCFIPCSELAVSFVNWLVTLCVPPRLLPKLDLSKGIPNELKTVVAVPCLLSSEREIASLLSSLEVHYLSNPEPALRFALLTDFTDNRVGEHASSDQHLLSLAADGIRRLNLKYERKDGSPFLLFHRSRQWNQAEGCWMGWERKRGKLTEFNRWALAQGPTSFSYFEGDVDWCRSVDNNVGIRFVITLDADTQIPNGVAAKLVGALAHPLNSPQIDSETGKVTSGYTVLQPRIGIRLSDATRTRYSRFFATNPGIDPYVTSASDVYQDLFAEGSYTGKGIYDLRAFSRVLDQMFPDNQILSHDLIEGCHVRAALVSDIELTDGFPARYQSDARRQHRWARGDWQLIPWLMPRVPTAIGRSQNRLSVISRWKIVDNLRRSFVPITLGLMLIVGWVTAPSSSLTWSTLAVIVIGFPLLAQSFNSIRNLRRATNLGIRLHSIAHDFSQSLLQRLFHASLLVHQSYLMLDAAARSIWRTAFSRRKRLEWETAADTELRSEKNRWSHWTPLIATSLFAAGIGLLMLPAAVPAALPWLVGWAAAPLFCYWINQNLVTRKAVLDDSDLKWLRLIARKTWAFFEIAVSEEDHWLPPDNIQEIPMPKTAHRVSPTNQGLYLVSGLAAYDFGFIGIQRLIDLWERNADTWERLERSHGHWFNWYDTTTLCPLSPRFVSTVDSGNLDACYLLLRQGIADLKTMPIVSERNWRGILDSIEMVDDAVALARIRTNPKKDRVFLDRVKSATRQLHRLLEKCPDGLVEWYQRLSQAKLIEETIATPTIAMDLLDVTENISIARKVDLLVEHLRSIRTDLTTVFPWLTMIATDSVESVQSNRSNIPEGLLGNARTNAISGRLFSGLTTLNDLESVINAPKQFHSDFRELADALAQLPTSDQQTGNDWIGGIVDGLGSGADAAGRLLSRLMKLDRRWADHSSDIKYGFLYNAQRNLFSVGFNFEDKQLDLAHYDMLCSEARLASFLAVGKGDVEAHHWFRLGRQLTAMEGRPHLLSWGGTMFEYLMPNLFQRTYDGSLLDESCRVAIQRQRQYGNHRNVPWGISESAFAALAPNADYQYRSFGVPGLGLKRGLGKDLVISPYSTFLTLNVEPQFAIKNLKSLASEGASGDWGFFEAVDYSSNRLPIGARSIVVRCFMAHHQGMSLMALSNALCGGAMQRRFHAHPIVRATELLLQERTPRSANPIQPHTDDRSYPQTRRDEPELVSRQITGAVPSSPRTHLLSNGHFTTMVTHNGSGFCRVDDIGITRWRPDATRDHWGQFVYFKEVRTGRIWSPTIQPTGVTPDDYKVLFSIDKAEFIRRDGSFESRLEVVVSPENHADVRTLRLTNTGSQTRQIELTTFAEISLATPAADRAHAAFEKLFVQTEYLSNPHAIIASRRQRVVGAHVPWAVHVMTVDLRLVSKLQWESNRQVFLGRGGSVRSPAALQTSARLSGTVGAVLDPIASLRCTVTLPPDETVTIGLATIFANSRDEAVSLAQQYGDSRNYHRAFDLAWAFSQMQLKHMHLTPTQAHLYQRIATSLLYPDPKYRGRADLVTANRQGQMGLWRFGISGDRPIVLLHLTHVEQLYLVRDLLTAQQYWRMQGLVADLVLLNDQPGSYLDLLHEELVDLLQEFPRISDDWSTGVFPLRGSQIPVEDKILLEAVSAIVLHGANGSLAQQIRASVESRANVRKLEPRRQGFLREFGCDSPGHSDRSAEYPAMAGHAVVNADEKEVGARDEATSQLEFWNGLGGFAMHGREYRILLSDEKMTPQPWCNVIANPNFGCLVTETGGGFTWAGNSRENRLSSWSNDPVLDPPAESVFVRDDVAWTVWSPFPHAFRDKGDYWIHHGQGYTQFQHLVSGIENEVRVFVARHDPVKFVRIRLRNRSHVDRQLSLFHFVEWVLGDTREKNAMNIVTSRDEQSGAMLATNGYHTEFSGQVAFLQVLETRCWITGDRTEFVGRNGDPSRPDALRRDVLSGRVGVGLDPCGAVQCKVKLAPMTEIEVVFVIGAGRNREAAAELIARFSTRKAVAREERQVQEFWDDLLGALEVQTPDSALNLLANRWLLYQVVSCRLWGRSAFYQSGGAFGFRDQLQDVLALMHSRPEMTRQHLLLAASRQFEEGDVQHWWHPPTGRGTRTRSSDDLLWLPFVAATYVESTGDDRVFDEQVTFLQSPTLESHELERYEMPAISSKSATLYEHCLSAINYALKFGQHGLPLIGTGDWNDGMNRLGEKGQGESVWLGWFLITVLERFASIARNRDDENTAHSFERLRKQLLAAIEEHGWDGLWYRRAYTDEAVPIGSSQNSECQIDSIAQSWAAFAGANPERVSSALSEASRRLIKRDMKLALLLTPPFDRGEVDPGYIQGYLPGVRENGGQYTHAAIWLMQALSITGRSREALDLLEMINPISHAASPHDTATYQVEPYVVAADVYGVEPHQGRGGWSWYTGSASWMYRAIIESILGIRVGKSEITFWRGLPPGWTQFQVTIRRPTGTWTFDVKHDPNLEPVGGRISVPLKQFSLTETETERNVTILLPSETARTLPHSEGHYCREISNEALSL